MAKKKSKTVFNPWAMLVIPFMVLALVITLIAFYTFKASSGPYGQPKKDITGSGAPSGPHFNLNIIGVPKSKKVDMTENKGRRIFVSLVGKTKINLTEGENYEVLDANGTDGKAAFQLPNPDPDNDGVTEYSVWARPRGKPGGKSETTTCALDEMGLEWCSIFTMVLVREKGKQSFTDVSKQILYIYADTDSDGSLERYPLFDKDLLDYYWSYDNTGLKVAQLRFYQVVSTVE